MASQTYFIRSKGWAIAILIMGLFSACRKETVQLVYKPCPGAELVRDVEQNTYPTVQIGDQCWLRENLRTSSYRNGDEIPVIEEDSLWLSTSAGAFSFYTNDPDQDTLEGVLYNHFAISDNRGLCPTGWHVPTDAEWTTLQEYISRGDKEGGALKDTLGWDFPNAGAANLVGYRARAAGFRAATGGFGGQGIHGFWWSATQADPGKAWSRQLNYASTSMFRNSNFLLFGMSVRCLKD
ncbi:MAG: fibrobacter succinogenes major paralogous domain-containing protein [Bacteroidota bacterium]